MNRPNKRFVLILIASLLSLSACTKKTIEWREEVIISTGDTIVITRSTHYVPRNSLYNFPWQNRWHPDKTSLEFRYPNSGSNLISWESKKKTDRTLSKPEAPLLVDVDSQSTPYVITQMYDKKIEGGRVLCLVYFRYLYKNGRWEEAPLPKMFLKKTANLYAYYEDKNLSGLIEMSNKKELIQRNTTLAWYINIGPQQRKCWRRGVNRPW